MKSILIEGDIARVELTQGQVAIVDTIDVPLIKEHSWNAMWSKDLQSYYAAASMKLPNGRRKTIYMHRVIAGSSGAQKTDHINHDTLDNRRSNLRICTNQQNMQNRSGANINSKSGVRGVSPFVGSSKLYWMVRVWNGGKSVVKYFPYTDEGLGEAAKCAEQLRAETMTHSTNEARAAYNTSAS